MSAYRRGNAADYGTDYNPAYIPNSQYLSEEQKYAEIFLHDIQRGDVTVESGKTLRDYITEYRHRAQNDQICRFATAFGLDEEKLRDMMDRALNETNINEFGRLEKLKKMI